MDGTHRDWGHVGLALGDGRVVHALHEVRVDDADTLALLASELKAAKGGGGGQVQLDITDTGRTVSLLAGRDYDIDAELAARVERIAGAAAVAMSVVPAPQLALVG